MKQKMKNLSRVLKRDFTNNFGLYLLLIPAVLFVIIFCYIPMGGVVLAFKEYDPNLGIFGSPYVGFTYFEQFFSSYYVGEILWNTFAISALSLVIGFPLPIIFALIVNLFPDGKFKKIFLTISYLPNFISVVVIVAMINGFFDYDAGFINILRDNLGLERIAYLLEPERFYMLFVWTGVWQSIGWSSLLYTSTLSSVDPVLYEAAVMDGATLLDRIIYIDFPSIKQTLSVCLIMAMGGILSVGFDKVYLMQNNMNLPKSEVISTYVYKVGLLNAEYGFGTAIGLFNSVVSFILLAVSNFVSKKTSGESIW